MPSKSRRALLVVATCVSMVAFKPARASSLQDDLTRCIVSHVTPADEEVVMDEIFGLIALSPKLKLYTTMTEAQRAAINQKYADLHTRLLTKDCHAETVFVLKTEGESGTVPGFRAIGGAAMSALLATPEAHARVLEIHKLCNTKPQMDALRAEAGLPLNPK